MEIDQKNDYDQIADDLQRVMSTLAGSTHEGWKERSDSLTITKEGFVRSVIRLQRTINYVQGLAEGHRIYQKNLE